MDITERQALINSLRQRSKHASSSVSTKVEANKGDYSVVVMAEYIDHLYKGNSVGKIKLAELDEATITFINSDAQAAAQEMLDSFASSFDKESFEKAASTTSVTKTAAHETLDSHTWQMTTQKQLDEQKPKLHPRIDEYPTTVTQKQLPEAGMRPGTYEEITEAQMRDEKSTFYNEPLDGGKRMSENRNITTEGQFEEGISKVSDHAQSERGEMGAKFDGDIPKQHKMTGEKQLAELLKHHEWTEPLTTTEGKDQLQKQDGELSRLTAEVAKKIIKEALSVLGNTVLAAGVTPKNLASIIKQLTSHTSKYPVLANTISQYAELSTKAISEKIAKAQYFGKVANTNLNLSNELVADILVRQLSKLAYNSQYVVDGLVALANHEKFVEEIDKATNAILANTTQQSIPNTNVDVFAEALKPEKIAEKVTLVGSPDKDGLYQYIGSLDEVTTASGISLSQKDEFVKAAATYADKIIKANINDQSIQLKPLTVDVNEELGTFKIQMKDTNYKPASIETRASKRQELAKRAQFGGAGGAGGMPPAGGAGMNNPMAPPGGGDANQPPAGEAFSQEPPPPPGEEGMEEGGMGGEPKPPGAICPACAGEDVDADSDGSRCNACGAEWITSVKLDVTKWPETLHETSEPEEPGFGLGAEDEQGGMGDDMGMGGGEPAPGGEGSGTTIPNVPVAASMRITPRLLEKIAEKKIELGEVCPNCASRNTDRFKSASHKGLHGVCYDCQQDYNFQVKANTKKAHNVFAQWIWTPKTAESCTSCNRLRTSFIKSLNDYGMKTKEFDKLSMKDKGQIILKMAKAKTFKLALDTPISVKKFAASFKSKFEKFPDASCREKLARRFGENATAMSGPCQGEKLPDCVCNQLKDLGIYTDGLAAKVASVLGSKDPMENNPSETCVRMFMNDNHSIKEACTICDGLRAYSASDNDLLIEAIAQLNPLSPSPMNNRSPKPMKMKPSISPMKPSMPGAKPMMAPGAGMGGMGGGAPKPINSPAGEFMGTPEPKPMPSGMGGGMPGAGAGAGGMGGGMSGGMPGGKPMGMDPTMDQGMSPMESPEMGGDLNANPMEEPVTDIDDGFGGGMEDEMGGIGDDMGMGGDFDDSGLDSGMGGGMGGEGDVKSILIEGLQSILQALQGGLGGDMLDTTGDDMGMDGGMGDDMGMGEDSGDLGGESEGIPGDDSGSDFPGSESDEGSSEDSSINDDDSEGGMGNSDTDGIPGLMNEDSGSDDDLEKEGNDNPFGGEDKKEMSKPSQHQEQKAAEANNPLEKLASKDLDSMLYHMKRGTISKTTTGVSNLYDNLMKVAKKADSDIKKTVTKEAKESKITTTPAQDAKGIGKIQDKGKMGHEEAFALKGPDVPRGKATIGSEDSEITLNDSDRPSVPHGSSLMAGEEHFKPEQGNVVDGNQGGQKAASSNQSKKIAEKDAKPCNSCKKPMKACKCASTKTSQQESCKCGKEECPKCQGQGTYQGCKCGKEECTKCQGHSAEASVKTNKKQAQKVSPKPVKNLEDDPDLNQNGKTHADATHSLAIDEKKPSEGMNEPNVPEAPNGGTLKNEHTYDNKLEGPTIPAGGGMNPDYDQNEKNKPEKLEQTRGKDSSNGALASTNNERAIKIAGQMLKSQMITIDELPNKIAELSKASSAILDDYDTMIKSASNKKGLQKTASAGSETAFQLNIHGKGPPNQDTTNTIQGLFSLDKKNKSYEAMTGNPRLGSNR